MTRISDLELRPKNRIFDLDRLRDVESKKVLMQKMLKKQSKSEKCKSKSYQIYEGCLNMITAPNSPRIIEIIENSN